VAAVVVVILLRDGFKPERLGVTRVGIEECVAKGAELLGINLDKRLLGDTRL
jgi:hypothetical protein